VPDFGLLHCAEVELRSRLQISAPRIVVWDKRARPPNCERPASAVCVDILHKKQGEKVLKTEEFWLDFPRLFMI